MVFDTAPEPLDQVELDDQDSAPSSSPNLMPTRSLSLSSFPPSFLFLFSDFRRTLLFLFRFPSLFPLHLSFGLDSQAFWLVHLVLCDWGLWIVAGLLVVGDLGLSFGLEAIEIEISVWVLRGM
ncbi:hypothetical protein Drorol1_Dr00000602 [Drosera rotundifolia]